MHEKGTWGKNTAKKFAQSCLPEFTPADLVIDTILPVLWDHLLLELRDSDLHDLSGPEMTLMVTQTELLSVSMSI